MEFGVLFSRWCSVPSPDLASAAKIRRLDDTEGPSAGKPGNFTTADQEFNLGVQVVQILLEKAAAEAVAAGKIRVDLTQPEWRALAESAPRDPHRPVPVCSASALRHVWHDMYDSAGGLAGVFERLLRDRLPVEGNNRRGERLAIAPWGSASVQRGADLLSEIQLGVSFGVDGGVRLDFVDTLNCSPVLKNMVLGIGSPIARLILVHGEEALGEIYAKLGSKEISPNEYVGQFRKSTESGRGGRLLFRLCVDLLGLNPAHVSLSTTSGGHRADYAQTVVLFHALLPQHQGKLFFQQQMGLWVVSKRTPQDTQEVMNFGRLSVSRRDTNRTVSDNAAEHTRNTGLVLMANYLRFILLCWDNFRDSWRTRQYGPARTPGLTGVAHTDVITFAAKVAEIENHYPAGTDVGGLPPVAQPPEGYVTFVDGSVASLYLDGMMVSVFGPGGLNYVAVSDCPRASWLAG